MSFQMMGMGSIGVGGFSGFGSIGMTSSVGGMSVSMGMGIGMPGMFDSFKFSPEAMMSGGGGFMHPLAMGGIGGALCGFNGGCGMVPGMGMSCCGAGGCGNNKQMMQSMMASLQYMQNMINQLLSPALQAMGMDGSQIGGNFGGVGMCHDMKGYSPHKYHKMGKHHNKRMKHHVKRFLKFSPVPRMTMGIFIGPGTGMIMSMGFGMMPRMM